jgi:hypothetical protein
MEALFRHEYGDRVTQVALLTLLSLLIVSYLLISLYHQARIVTDPQTGRPKVTLTIDMFVVATAPTYHQCSC